MIHSAGVIVVDSQKRLYAEPAVLCVRAYSNWDFPKGMLEPDETHIDAAIRELEEETTLRDGVDVKVNADHAFSVVYASGANTKKATYFLASRTSKKPPSLPYSPELGKPENDEYRWVKLSKLRSLLPPRLHYAVEFIEQRVKHI